MPKVARKARLWNRGDTDFHQIVNGTEYHIKAGDSITVSRREAVVIRGHYCGKNVPVSLEIEKIFENVSEDKTPVTDHRTGQLFPTQDAYLQHLGINNREHVDVGALKEQILAELKQDPANKTVEKEYICPFCEGSFTKKQGLIIHMRACEKKQEKMGAKAPAEA